MHLRDSIILAALFAAPLFTQSGCAKTTPHGFQSDSPGNAALQSIPQRPHTALCPTAKPGGARCFAHVVTDDAGQVVVNAAPQGFGPPDLASAYALPVTGGSGKTVALVDANDDPYAESDLATYRAQYGLPPCTTANGCFRKVNQQGQQSNYPAASSDWAGEISLDIQMVSAICPSCNILLVEADSADMSDLGAGVNIAAQLGASAISNSYGGGEDSTVPQESEQYFNHPGIVITASSGDGAYGVNFPASSQYVVGVGGTSLVQSTTASRGWVEGAWSDAGSGCSAYSPKPSWQTDTGCSQRTVADVSAVADPNTGLAVYSTYDGGWIVLGGTSASSPIVAATFALTGQTGQTARYLYDNPGLLFDVTSGSNGDCGSYLCNAGPGYDGPTGLGTPNASLWAGGGGGSSSSGGGSGSGSGSSSGGASSGGGSGGGTPDAGTGGDDAGGGGSSSGGGGGAGPQVTLDSPDDGASLAGNTTIQLVADVSASAGVSDVVLDWVEPQGSLTVDCNAPPSGVTCTSSGTKYTFAFAATTGARTWSITATDGNGATTQSETRSLTLVDTSGPSASFDAPPSGSTYSPGDMVQVVVEASAPAGVSDVWLAWHGSEGEQDYELSFVGGTEWAVTLPGILANAPSGSRELTVTVTDAQGNTGTASITIEVQ
jgi:hypothetical protein